MTELDKVFVSIKCDTTGAIEKIEELKKVALELQEILSNIKFNILMEEGE